MYKHGHHHLRHHSIAPYMILILLAAGGVSGGLAYLDATHQSQITKSSTTPVVRQEVLPAKTITVGGPTFSLAVPDGWQLLSQQQAPQQYFEWRSTAKGTTARTLRVYIDSVPATMAVNRLLPVSTKGVGVTSGEISDNCASFVGPSPMTPQAAASAKPLPAKWQDINFICDLPNYIREVAGSGSADGINNVIITGPHSGPHRYFFLYTDHTAEPDFTIFKTIIDSFQAK